MSRSRWVFARIDAPAIEKCLRSPPTQASCGTSRPGNPAAVHQGELRCRAESRDGPLHGQQTGMENVQPVDLRHRRLADPHGDRIAGNDLGQLAAAGTREFLGVVHAVDLGARFENHRGGDNRARQRAHPGLVDTGDAHHTHGATARAPSPASNPIGASPPGPRLALAPDGAQDAARRLSGRPPIRPTPRKSPGLHGRQKHSLIRDKVNREGSSAAMQFATPADFDMREPDPGTGKLGLRRGWFFFGCLQFHYNAPP